MSSRFEDLPRGEAPAQGSPALSKGLALAIRERLPLGARPPEPTPGCPDSSAGVPVRAASYVVSMRRRRRG
jgi:hypothetical protein